MPAATDDPLHCKTRAHDDIVDITAEEEECVRVKVLKQPESPTIEHVNSTEA